jgi:carboxymethylenebutenolidase
MAIRRAWRERSSSVSRRNRDHDPGRRELDIDGRREFLRRLWTVTTAVPVSAFAVARSTAAQVVIPSEFDTSLDSSAVAFRAPTGMTLGYMSQPKAAGPRPGAVVVHDAGGLTPGIKGVARNLATSGYAVVAPDFLSPNGGTAGFRGMVEEVRRAVAGTSATAVSAQLTSALAYAKAHAGSGGRGFALLGFGWGATQTLLFAAGRTDIAACVAFYPDPEAVIPALAKVAAPSLMICAADDPLTSAGVSRLEQAAASGRRAHVVTVFPGVQRGFHDPGEAKIYKPDVAKQAWTAAIQHLDAHTKGKT